MSCWAKLRSNLCCKQNLWCLELKQQSKGPYLAILNIFREEKDTFFFPQFLYIGQNQKETARGVWTEAASEE